MKRNRKEVRDRTKERSSLKRKEIDKQTNRQSQKSTRALVISIKTKIKIQKKT